MRPCLINPKLRNFKPEKEKIFEIQEVLPTKILENYKPTQNFIINFICATGIFIFFYWIYNLYNNSERNLEKICEFTPPQETPKFKLPPVPENINEIPKNWAHL